jgi:hypothetical protein
MLRRLLTLGLLLALAQLGDACTRVDAVGPAEKVKPTFFVRVKGFGEPVAHVQVEATRSGPPNEGRPVFVALSNPEGYAQFHELPVGKYTLIVKDRFSASASIEVVPQDQTPIYYVYVGWPQDTASYQVRRAAGHVGGFCEKATCTISLLDGRTAARVADDAQNTTFDFGAVAPGAYMIHVEGRNGALHFMNDIPIRIDPNAQIETLNIPVGLGRC